MYTASTRDQSVHGESADAALICREGCERILAVRPSVHIVALAVNVLLGFRIGAELVVTFVSERQASAERFKLHVGAGASCPEESLSNNYLALCQSSVERRA